MRECYNEDPRVYEAEGDDLPALLRQTADTLEQLEDYSHSGINVYPGFESAWLVVLVVF